MDPIITIGREYGSGGREIGKLVADKLGVPFYDKEILTRAAEESGLCHELLERHDEKNTVSGMLAGSAGASLHVGAGGMGLQMPLNQRVFLAQFDAITKIAAEGPGVIVGRCADYVLRDRNPFRIFIYADQASKIKRCMERKPAEEDLSQREMKKKMAEIDRNRSKYYEFFSEQKWGVRANYDLLLNTTDKDIEKMASAVYAYVKEAFA